jgi:hypothetical protein
MDSERYGGAKHECYAHTSVMHIRSDKQSCIRQRRQSLWQLKHGRTQYTQADNYYYAQTLHNKHQGVNMWSDRQVTSDAANK